MLVRFLESKASRDIVAHAFAYTKEPQIKSPRNHQGTTNDPPVKHSGTTKEPTWSKASHVRSHIRSRSIEQGLVPLIRLVTNASKQQHGNDNCSEYLHDKFDDGNGTCKYCCPSAVDCTPTRMYRNPNKSRLSLEFQLCRSASTM